MKLVILDSQNVRKSIDVMESSTVAQLKEEIKNQNNINGVIFLHFNGDILEDSYKLCDYKIEDGDVIVYIGRFPIN